MSRARNPFSYVFSSFNFQLTVHNLRKAQCSAPPVTTSEKRNAPRWRNVRPGAMSIRGENSPFIPKLESRGAGPGSCLTRARAGRGERSGRGGYAKRRSPSVLNLWLHSSMRS
jgi:hypothetical protein